MWIIPVAVTVVVLTRRKGSGRRQHGSRQKGIGSDPAEIKYVETEFTRQGSCQ
jgi:hypothetical protein